GTRDRARDGARSDWARPFRRRDYAAGMVSRGIAAHVAGPSAGFHARSIPADPPSCSAAGETADSGERNIFGAKETDRPVKAPAYRRCPRTGISATPATA